MMPKVLVFGQFAAIAVLLFGGDWTLPLWSWVLFSAGLLVFLFAVFALGRANFTIMPEPRIGNALSQRGIYRRVRHPMYSAVLICGCAMAFGAPSIWRTVALVVCVVVLVAKVRYEEARLTLLHPEYPQRMSGTYRLVPGIW